jgi:hypothetical protein
MRQQVMMKKYEQVIEGINAQFRETFQNKADPTEVQAPAATEEVAADDVQTAADDSMAEGVAVEPAAIPAPKPRFVPLLLDGSKQPDLAGEIHEPVLVKYKVATPAPGTFTWTYVPDSVKQIKATKRGPFQLYADVIDNKSEEQQNKRSREQKILEKVAAQVNSVEGDVVAHAHSAHTKKEVEQWEKKVEESEGDEKKEAEKELHEAKKRHHAATEGRDKAIEHTNKRWHGRRKVFDI